MEPPRKVFRFIYLELCQFLFWIPAQFGLCVEMVPLDAEVEVIPFFAATGIFRILNVKAG
jgi:hypothetical protein